MEYSIAFSWFVGGVVGWGSAMLLGGFYLFTRA